MAFFLLSKEFCIIVVVIGRCLEPPLYIAIMNRLARAPEKIDNNENNAIEIDNREDATRPET